MPVFSRILQKVSRWELPSPQYFRRELSSPPLSEHSFSSEHSFAIEQMLASPEAAFRDQSESNDSLEVLSGNASCTLAASHVGSGRGRFASRLTAQSGSSSPASCTLAASHFGSGRGRSASRSVTAPDVLDQPSVQTGGFQW